MGKYLLLSRIKYDDGKWDTKVRWEVKHFWCDSEEELFSCIERLKEAPEAKVFIDYAAEILEDRSVLKRKLDEGFSFDVGPLTRGRYLLLSRSQDDGKQLVSHQWFDNEESMVNMIHTLERPLEICPIRNNYIDYAAEIIKDRVVVERKFDRNLELCEESKRELARCAKDAEEYPRFGEQVKSMFEKYGIDVEAEFIAGYPLASFISLLDTSHLEYLEMIPPPGPNMKDKILEMFVKAIDIAETECGGIFWLRTQLRYSVYDTFICPNPTAYQLGPR